MRVKKRGKSREFTGGCAEVQAGVPRGRGGMQIRSRKHQLLENRRVTSSRRPVARLPPLLVQRRYIRALLNEALDDVLPAAMLHRIPVLNFNFLHHSPALRRRHVQRRVFILVLEVGVRAGFEENADHVTVALAARQSTARAASTRQEATGQQHHGCQRRGAVSTATALACMYLKERGHVRLVTRHLQAQCRGESLSLLQSLT